MHVVITGASSGIGAALAREFGSDASTSLTLVARRRNAMEEIARAVAAKTANFYRGSRAGSETARRSNRTTGSRRDS